MAYVFLWREISFLPLANHRDSSSLRIAIF